MVLVNYVINKRYIAAELCEKKEIKNNCCQGSCYVEKQLKKQDSPATPQLPHNLKDLADKPMFMHDTQVKLSLYCLAQLTVTHFPFATTHAASFNLVDPPPRKI